MTNTRTAIWDWTVFAILAAAALAPAIAAGGSDFTFPDAPRHAMDGVFVLDAITAHPFTHPVEWAKNYYLTSPALGMGRYPPLFAIIEAPFYAVLGVTPLAARLAGALVWLAGLLFFYEAVRRSAGRIAGAFAAFALASGPATVLWGGEVMLELPATAFLLAAAYCYVRYVEGQPRRWLTAALLLACLAGWVKQPAALGVLVIIAHVIFYERPARLLGEMWPGLAVSAVLLAPLAAMSFVFGSANIALMTGTGQTFPLVSVGNWLFYAVFVPDYYLGWPIAVMTVAGFVSAFFRRRIETIALWVIWIGIFWLFFTLVGYKTPRLAMFWTPGLCFFAGLGVAWLAGEFESEPAWRIRRAVMVAICALAVARTYAYSWQSAPRLGKEMQTVALKALQALPERILYAGHENGTFIFRMRELAGPEPPMVIRDSKILYADVIQSELGRLEPVRTMDEVKAVIAKAAPDVVVVERSRAATEEMPMAGRLFLLYTHRSEFELIDEVTARPGTGRKGTTTFELYNYRGPREAGALEVPMPGVGMALTLPAETK